MCKISFSMLIYIHVYSNMHVDQFEQNNNEDKIC